MSCFASSRTPSGPFLPFKSRQNCLGSFGYILNVFGTEVSKYRSLWGMIFFSKQTNKRSPNASVNLSKRTRVSSALILSLAHGCLQFLTKAQILVWGYQYTCEVITLLGSNGKSSLGCEMATTLTEQLFHFCARPVISFEKLVLLRDLETRAVGNFVSGSLVL